MNKILLHGHSVEDRSTTSSADDDDGGDGLERGHFNENHYGGPKLRGHMACRWFSWELSNGGRKYAPSDK